MKTSPSFCLLALASLAVGCGGGKSSSDGSQYAGTYAGSYASTSDSTTEGGALSLVISSRGAISGTLTPTGSTSPERVQASSHVDRNGQIVLAAAIDTGSAVLTQTYQGTLTKTDATLSGTLTSQRGDLTVPYLFSLSRSGG